MRSIVGLLLLLGLCAAAWQWQTSWSDGVRAERETLRNTPGGLREREESWGELRVGRPSGAAPIALEGVDVPDDPGVEGDEELPFLRPPAPGPDDGGGGAPPPVPDDAPFEYVVPGGRVLSKICEEFYGSGRPPIPDRVAEFNGMSSPDDLREGQTLRLPDWSVLFPDGRERPR